MKKAVLLLDAENATLRILEQAIRQKLGYPTLSASRCEDALRLARVHTFQLAVIEVNLPDGKGYHIIPGLKDMQPGLHIVMTSWDYSEETERLARACGLVLYMTKPLDLTILEAALRTAWQNSMKPGCTSNASLSRVAGAFA